MSVENYPVNTPFISGSDIEAVKQCLAEGWISGEGPFVERFERSFAQMLGVEHCTAVSSGTAALQVAFAALKLPPKTEVILPSMTIFSALLPILEQDLTPVFVDVDKDTWNMTAPSVKSAMTSDTSAILAVHTYGLGVDVEALTLLARDRRVRIIEDCAESTGLQFGSRMSGTIGDIGTHSFYANKLISCGEGGMLSTDSEELDRKFRLLRNLSFSSDVRFLHRELGWNFRMASAGASLGYSQLQRWQQSLQHKRDIAARYRTNLSNTPGLTWQPQTANGANNVFWVVGLVLDPNLYGSAKEVREGLSKRGVETRSFFHPLHRQPLLHEYGLQDQPVLQNTEYLWNQGLYLPSGNGLTLESVDAVSELVVETLADASRS